MSETEKLEGSGSEKRKYKYGSDAEKEIDDYGRKRDEEMRKEKHRSSEDEYRRSKKKRRRSRSSSNSSSSSRSSSSSSSSSEDDRRRTKSRSKSKDYSRGRKRESNYNDGNRENWYPQGFSQDQPNMGYQQNVQYTDGSYQQNYNSQNFRGGYNTYPEYDQGYYQGQNFQQPVTHEYSMGGPAMQGAGWDNNVYDVSRPSVGADAGKTDEAKKEAVEQELIQQKLTLSKQREEYIRKKSSLTRELNRLKEQKRELMAEDTKENERILRENSKLRSEIANKLKSMDSVIEMLSNIIGDKDNLHEVIEEIRKKDKKSEKKKHDESPKHKEKIKSRSRSPSLSDQGESKYNLVHYDPELHWCSECNVFPRTIVDYLNHLHSDEHKAAKSKLKLDEMPWHVDFPKESTPPFVKDTPYKRVPIRGVQFLVPSSAWYCSLCKEWLGDLILATKHLKMRLHAKKYKEFTSQNPDWEVDWLTERTKSYERTSSEAKKDKEDSVKEQPSSTMASLGDQLLAMIQNSKHQKDDDSKSSSSSESERESKHKGKKKKKKSKKKKSSKKKSPTPEPKKDFNSLYDDLIKSEKNTFESYYKNEFNGSDSKKEDKKSSDEESDAEPKQLDPDEIRKAFKDTKIVLNAERPYVYKVSKPAEEEPAKPSNPLPVSDEDSNEKNHSKVKKDKKKDSKKDRRDKHRDRDRDRDGDHRRDRDRDRDRDYGRYRDRSRSRDRRRRDREPPRRRYPKPKTPERKKKKGIEEEKEETVWEKRASELLKKKEVKKTSFTIPKTKLPFIGRMPVMKKKSEPKPEDNQEEGQEHRVLTLAEIKKMKSQEHFMTEVAKLHREQQIKAIRALHTLYHLSGQVPPFPLPPLDPEYFEVPKVQVREVVPETYGPILPPVVIDPVPVITPLDIPTPLEPPPADMPVPMIPIIPSQIQVAETDVVPPTLPVPMSEIETQPKPNDDNIEQDMEIEEEQQPPPVATPKSKEDLHEDFKEALDMLFPENGKPRPIIKPQKVEVKPPSPPPGTVTYDIAVMASKMGYDISMYTEQGQQYQAYYMQQQQQGSKFVKQYETGAKFPNKNYQGPEVGSIPNVEGIPPPSKQDEPLDIKPPEEKKKNPPSQRMRRHLKKLALKKAQQEEEAARMHEAQLLLEQSTNDENESTDTNQEGNANDDSQETPVQEMAVDPEPTLPPPDKKPFIPREMSELEMLGIEEGDFGAQNFA